jgi:oligopeptidase A
VRQLEFALFDLKLHSGTPRPFMAVLKEARQQTAVLPAPEWNRFPCCFSHIFAGGYAAGYYSYLWAEVLAADAFALFTESGDVLNAELGSRFRQEVLAVGGSRPAMQSFTAFRGRVPKPAALLKHYGLVD